MENLTLIAETSVLERIGFAFLRFIKGDVLWSGWSLSDLAWVLIYYESQSCHFIIIEDMNIRLNLKIHISKL